MFPLNLTKDSCRLTIYPEMVHNMDMRPEMTPQDYRETLKKKRESLAKKKKMENIGSRSTRANTIKEVNVRG